jgi:hypothetical protein
MTTITASFIAELPDSDKLLQDVLQSFLQQMTIAQLVTLANLGLSNVTSSATKLIAPLTFEKRLFAYLLKC